MHKLGSPVCATMFPRSASHATQARIKSHAPIMFVVLLLFILGLAPKGLCVETAHPRSVVIVVANWLSLDDLLSAGGNVLALLDDAAVGLMNTGRYRQDANEVRYLVLGAGEHLSGAGGAAECYASGELIGEEAAGEVYLRQTGRQPPEGGVVCLGLSRILSANRQDGASVGLLGEAFRTALTKTALIGSVEPPEAELRWAGLIAMDRTGAVDSAFVGSEVVKAEPNSPYGIVDDVDVVAGLIGAHLQSHSLIVVQLADLSRCESARVGLTESAYVLYRSLAVRDLDALVGRLRPRIERTGSALIICSPSGVRPTVGYSSNLTPVVCFGRGFEPGLLTSSTTLTQGLIGNIDIAPTVLRVAGLPIPESVAGCPARVVPSRAGIETLGRMEHIAARNYAIRGPVLGGVAVMTILAATLTEVLLLGNAARPLARRAFRLIIFILISFPAASLVVDGIGFAGLGGYVPALVAVALVFVAVASFISSLPRIGRASTFGVLLMMTAFLVSVDVWTGEHLLRWSAMTCNQIVGIRYYGLGNEYMGILVGAGLIGPLLMLNESRANSPSSNREQRRGRAIALSIWLTLLAITIGYPALGSNVGGFVTAVAAFGVALVLVSGSRFRFVHALVLIGVAVSALVLFAVLDAHRSASSHLGRSLTMAGVSGGRYIVALVSRKLAMHIGILKLPQTYFPVLCSIPFLLMYRDRASREAQALAKRVGLLQTVGIPAVMAGAVVGFFVNDSGIVPAGILICMLILALLQLRLKEVHL